MDAGDEIGIGLTCVDSWYNIGMYAVELEQETDGRWIAEVPELPGVMAYGNTRDEALRKAQALSLRVLAERLEHGESLPQVENVFSIVA
jgi:predicted RNase H-like HicB family nuclease